jgi:sugar lactone lactonase YvrE
VLPNAVWTRLGLSVAAATLAAVTATVAAVAATGASGVSGDNTITRFAGVPKKAFGGFSGDGGPALRAELSVPVGVAVDGKGNVYFADRNNVRVRKVNTSGIISTFAGGADVGYPSYGDGGPATGASLSSPWGVAVDGQGNVYISERGRNAVRKVSPGGIISTFAGTGQSGFSGDGGPATSALLSGPQGLALDIQGNLYISDYGNGRVRKVDRGGIITTVAGKSPSGFSGDGGPATSAQLHGPAGLTVDAKGNLYIADQLNSRIRKVSAGGTIATVAGGGKSYPWGKKGLPARSALVPNPFVVAVDARGSVYTASGRLIYKVSGGRIALLAGNPNAGSPYSGDNGPVSKSRLTETWGMAIDRQGSLYFSDIWTQTIRKIWATRTG